MRVVGLSVIAELMKTHAASRKSCRAWLAEVRAAHWTTPAELKDSFPRASILSDNRVVFDIGGNKYRVVCGIAYKLGIVDVLRAGTHAEYDKWVL